MVIVKNISLEKLLADCWLAVGRQIDKSTTSYRLFYTYIVITPNNINYYFGVITIIIYKYSQGFHHQLQGRATIEFADLEYQSGTLATQTCWLRIFSLLQHKCNCIHDLSYNNNMWAHLQLHILQVDNLYLLVQQETLSLKQKLDLWDHRILSLKCLATGIFEE